MFYWVPPEGGIGSPGPPAGGYPPAKKEDKDLVEAVRLALFLDPDIDEKKFAITAENGTIYLAGVARSENERRQVRDLALGVEGVREVVDQMRVVSEETTP